MYVKNNIFVIFVEEESINMKKKKIFSMLCAMSVMFNMITTPVFAEELNTTSVVSENTDVLPSEDIDLFFLKKKKKKYRGGD